MDAFYSEEIERMNEKIREYQEGKDVDNKENEEEDFEVGLILTQIAGDLYAKQLHLRYGTLMSLYSFLEISLAKLSNFVREANDIRLMPYDLRGSGIHKYKAYLEKVVGLELSHLNSIWEDLCSLNKIRNQIAHNNGLINKTSDIVKDINKSGNLSISSDGYIIVNQMYLTDSLRNVSKYIKSLISLLHKII